MNTIAQFSATLEVVASFLTFIAGYLAFALAIVIVLMIVELIAERSRVFREYGPQHEVPGGYAVAGVTRHAHRLRLMLGL